MKYILTFILSPFIFLGLAAIVQGVEGYWNLEDEVVWEKTEAIINDVELLVRPREKQDSLYQLKVEYQLLWNNQKQINQTIEEANKESGKRHFLELNFEKLKQAHKISVWVNPKNPSESSIFPVYKTPPSKYIGLIKLGFTFLVLPTGFLIFAWVLNDLEKSISEKIEMIN